MVLFCSFVFLIATFEVQGEVDTLVELSVYQQVWARSTVMYEQIWEVTP
jgi:hypothetical protein